MLEMVDRHPGLVLEDPIIQGRKQTILERRTQTILKSFKADDPSKSRRSFVKADDLLGSKQTILESKQTIFESKQTIRGESGRSQG